MTTAWKLLAPESCQWDQTIERMKKGYSKIRNEALAHAFAYMNLIEHWGSGIPRIIDKVKSAGLRDPEFIGGEVDLRINIYREQNNAISIKNGVDTEKNGIDGVKNGTDGVKNGIENGVDEVLYTDKDLSDHIQKLLKIITKYPTETQAQYAEKLGVSKRTISRIFSELKEQRHT